MDMRTAVLAAAVILLTGCPSPPAPAPPPTAPTGTPPAVPTPRPTACDVARLRADMGSAAADFSSCDVPAMVGLLGEDVRRAKAQCHAFVALEGDWKQRMDNWDRLLAGIEAKSPPSGGQASPVAESATVVKNRLGPMRASATLRNQRLNSLLDGVGTLEQAAGMTSPPVPDCE